MTRDFKGYANQPPAITWPDSASVAVSFVLNFEEGAEFSMTDGDAFNESIYEVNDLQTTYDPCIDTHFEYGTRVAYWRIMDLADKYGISMTVSSCGRAVERSPWLVLDAANRGHEIAAHGYRWQTHAGMGMAEERNNIAKTVKAIKDVTGKAPVGWHTRSVRTANTRSLLREFGFLYDSDAYNDDTPYFVNVDGGRHLVLPYSFDTNDMQFQNTNRFDTASSFASYVCDAYDWLAQEGRRFPRMLSVGLHLRMIGRPGRMKALEQIFKHIKQQADGWCATREQIAKHWIEHSAPCDN